MSRSVTHVLQLQHLHCSCLPKQPQSPLRGNHFKELQLENRRHKLIKNKNFIIMQRLIVDFEKEQRQ